MKLRKISINGAKLRYLFGGSGKPLILLHGWPASPRSYKPSLKILAENFTVYAPFLFDLKCNNTEEMSVYVKELSRQLDLKDVTLVGTSFGGMVASKVAPTCPCIKRTFLINAAGLPRKASVLVVFAQHIASSFKLLVTGKLTVLYHRYTAVMKFFLKMRRRETRNLLKEIDSGNFEEAFRKMPSGTVIVWSDKDTVFPLSYATALKGFVKNSQLITVKGNHSWHYCNPKLFAKIIAET